MKSKMEPPHTRDAYLYAVNSQFHTVTCNMVRSSKKTPKHQKNPSPPLHNSARSNSKYIGEKPSVMLWCSELYLL